MNYAVPAPYPRTAANQLRLLPGLVVGTAVFFNAGLAVVNAHVMALSESSVISVELALVIAAHAIALANYRPQMLPWYALIAAAVLIGCYRSVFLDQFDPKYMRDVVLIPTFVVLGMTFDPRNLKRIVVTIHAVVMAVLLLEAFATPVYAALFRIQDYYINTRGYEVANFWNKQSELYVSAIRPGTRLFSFIDLHRLSSIFLEPVTLGNYCIVITAYLCACYRDLGASVRIFIVLGTIIALVGSDGRLAAVSSVLVVGVSLTATRLPSYAAAFYLPVVAAATWAMVHVGGYEGGSDDFPGRIAHSVELLSGFGLTELAGLSNDQALMMKAVDCGLGYLILTQSLVGTAVIWLFVVLSSSQALPEQTRFTHAAGLYLSLTMMVSFAFLSIKSAALLWFIHGVLQSGAPLRPLPTHVRTDGRMPLAALRT